LLFGAVNRKLTIRDYYLDPGDDERADPGAGLKPAEEKRFAKINLFSAIEVVVKVGTSE